MLFSSHIGELVDTGNVDFASQWNILKTNAIVD